MKFICSCNNYYGTINANIFSKNILHTNNTTYIVFQVLCLILILQKDYFVKRTIFLNGYFAHNIVLYLLSLLGDL